MLLCRWVARAFFFQKPRGLQLRRYTALKSAFAVAAAMYYNKHIRRLGLDGGLHSSVEFK